MSTIDGGVGPDPVTVAPAYEPRLPGPTAAPQGPPERPDPRAERVVAVAGGWRYDAAGGAVLAAEHDDALARFGPRLYDWMANDDQVSASFAVLRMGILGDGLKLAPAVARPQGREPTPEEAADADLAAEVAAFCGWALDRLEQPIDLLLEEMLDALKDGSALAEKTTEATPVADGPWKGKIAYAHVRVKPRTHWRWVVDRYMGVVGVYAQTADGPRVIDRSKFFGLSWRPKAGDPRGTSIFRPAYTPWNSKIQRVPWRAQFVAQWADPSVVLKYDPGGEHLPPVDPETGETVAGAPALSPFQQAHAALAGYAGGSGLVIPVTWEVDTLEPRADGGAFEAAEEADDRKIARAILLAARATMEAKYGSRADSDTAFDVLELLFGRGRAFLARGVEWDLLYPLVLVNYGRSVADRLTPRAVFGTSRRAVAALMTALANLFKAGAVPPALLPQLFTDVLGIAWPEGVVPGGSDDTEVAPAGGDIAPEPPADPAAPAAA